MDSTTNLAIIGYGHMGNIYRLAYEEIRAGKHAEDYYKGDLPRWLKTLRLRAVVDPRHRMVARGGLRVFSSVDDLISSGVRIDCAILATPIDTHYRIARQLIECGVHLLIEKPVSETAKEIQSLIRLAARRGVKLMPGHVERYNPVTLDARETVRYRMYGRLNRYALTRTSRRPERVREDLVLDKLIHDIDLVHCIVGSFQVSKVKVRRQAGRIVECTVSTRHRSGATGTIFSSWLVPEKKRTVDFFFDRAHLSGNLIDKTLRILRFHEMSKEITGYRNNQIRDQLADFVYYLYSQDAGVKPLVRMSDALKSGRVIDEIRAKVIA